MSDKPTNGDRRSLVIGSVAFCSAWVVPTALRGQSAAASAEPPGLPAQARGLPEVSPDAWYSQLVAGRDLGRPLAISRFLDRVWWLNDDAWWEPAGQPAARVTAPRGFVTDLASIPRLFWSVLAPDDQYAYAAVIHDWLYWSGQHRGQALLRRDADAIMVAAMRELQVSEWKIEAIDLALNHFGQAAWDDNARRRSEGEKRVLRVFPQSPQVRWSDWRLQPDVFVD